MVTTRPSRVRLARSTWLLLVLMLAFTAWFSAYSIRLHDAHLTHKADLGQMDLAIWNTAHGRFVQEVKQDTVSTRLTDHVELIFAPISLVFWLWDDVRALLVLQAAALAVGALPIYLLVRRRAQRAGFASLAGWAGLVFAAAYLLTPALQAAAVSEFHAAPFAAPLSAWALYAVDRRRWGWFALATLSTISVQEGLALLGTMLGLYAVARSLWPEKDAQSGPRWQGVLAGSAMFVSGLAWFYVTTFVVIPHFAAQAYGIDASPYTGRYGALGDSFADVLKSFVTQPGRVWATIEEPLRLKYLVSLLAPTGFLALLGPEVLALSLPLLLANLLSGYAFQYSGELHYTAPLVPYFVVAAAFGLGRILAWSRSVDRPAAADPSGRSLVRQPHFSRTDTGGTATRGPKRPRFCRVLWAKPGRFPATPALAPERRAYVLAAGAGLVLLAALACQAQAGYTPIGGEYWRKGAGGWPAVSAHQRLLARFLAQVPAGEPGSTTADLYPHLSHRELLFQFPDLGTSTWALVDVAGTTDRHPAAIQSAIEKLLRGGWGVVDAADGYVLLRRGTGAAALPDAFYDFARAPGARPQHALDVTFGGRLRLIGYDVVDDTRWRSTGLRYYWQALAPPAADTAIAIQIVTPEAESVDNSRQRPLPALLWYPPGRWQVGETVVTESPAWYLPKTWAPSIEVTAGGQSLTAVTEGASGAAVTGDGRARLPAWSRQAGRLTLYTGPLRLTPVNPAEARFGGPDWQVALTGYEAPAAVCPGCSLDLTLRWQVEATAPSPRDYTIFLQLRDAAGQKLAGGDATPAWFERLTTTHWQGQAGTPFVTLDAHRLVLPPDLPPGRYSLVAGWYYWETGERLPHSGPEGNVEGDEVVVGSIDVTNSVAVKPDLTCLLAPESCASQE